MMLTKSCVSHCDHKKPVESHCAVVQNAVLPKKPLVSCMGYFRKYRSVKRLSTMYMQMDEMNATP